MCILITVNRSWYCPDPAEQVLNRLLARYGSRRVIVHPPNPSRYRDPHAKVLIIEGVKSGHKDRTDKFDVLSNRTDREELAACMALPGGYARRRQSGRPVDPPASTTAESTG
jgi:hypothetical protein